MTLRLLDLFAGAGGCTVGYARAGFDVVGVDVEHHDGYPDSSLSLFGSPVPDVEAEFVQADALDVLRDRAYLDTFDVVHASPPCPRYSAITMPEDRESHPDLIEPVRELLRAWGGVYVIENVEGAAPVMLDPVKLCGSAFDLRVRRHRLFESNVELVGTDCHHARQGTPIGVYGAHPEVTFTPKRPKNGTSRGQRARTIGEAREAMGIPWMGWDDLADAIPPAYTQHLGSQLAMLCAVIGRTKV